MSAVPANLRDFGTVSAWRSRDFGVSPILSLMSLAFLGSYRRQSALENSNVHFFSPFSFIKSNGESADCLVSSAVSSAVALAKAEALAKASRRL